MSGKWGLDASSSNLNISSSNLNTTASEGGFLAKKSASKARLIPCTVHEINSSLQKGDTFLSTNNLELNLVSVVGVIKSINETPSFIDYEIDDRTGASIIVKQFNDDEDTENKPNEFRVNMYVKVVGHIKSQQGVNFLNSIKIMKIKSYNEVTYHMISVVYAHQSLRDDAHAAISQTGGGADDLKEKLFSLFRINKSEPEGISINYLISRLSEYNENEIRSKVEFMANEGHIFATVSDDVFKLTE